VTELSKRIQFTREISKHLAELTQLAGRSVGIADLLSLAETEAIREKANAVARIPSWRCRTNFSEKNSLRFRKLISDLHALNPASVYVWTPLSNVCGLLRPVALVEINFAFDFFVNREGIFSVLTVDLLDRLLLDYEEISPNDRQIQIEVAGQHWGRAEIC